MSSLSSLSGLLSASDATVFFGGAGVSTESGIPDFRSATGLYTTHAGDRRAPEYLLSHTCFARETEDFFDFYRLNMLYPDARPNAAHRALATLEESGRLSAVVTQNIDGLHQQAGSRHVIELHGSVHRNYCVACRSPYDLQFILSSIGVPRCTTCGGIVRPDVVLYEEGLDGAVTEAALDAIAAAEVLIVGGTSLNVYPAAGMIDYFRGDHLVLINKTETPYDRRADLVIHDSLGRVLTEAIS
jgi:NAD-dependent deacetylase